MPNQKPLNRFPMKRIFTSVVIIFSFVYSQNVLGQCTGNTRSGAYCDRAPTGNSEPPTSIPYNYGTLVPNQGCGQWTTSLNNFGPGQYFQVAVLAGGCYTMSTCDATFDTQISCFQGNATTSPFAYNDNNGPACTGTRASVDILPNFSDYTRVQVNRYNCVSAGGTSMTVQVRQNNNLNIVNLPTGMCEGQSVALSATPARVTGSIQGTPGDRGTFTWTGGGTGTTFTAPTPSGASQVYTITYTFGFCSTSKDITVYKKPTIAYAGTDQVICGTTTSISANTPTSGIGQWTVVGGNATISQPGNATTNVTITSGNSATFEWSITNGPICPGSTSTVTVTRDNIPPTITCPSNQVTTVTPGTCSRSIIGLDASVSDVCGYNPYTFNMTGVTNQSGIGSVSGFTFNGGVTNVTYNVTDLQGNPASCSFTVTVTDNISPTITCPGNISVNSTPGACGAAVSYSELAVNDNCPGVTVATVSGGASGSTFVVGTTNVTLRAKDVAGNTKDCSFSVTVTDVQAPVVNCPGTINVNNVAGQCVGNATWSPVTATDNCVVGTPTKTSGPNQGPNFPIGTTTVIYTATDVNGLTGTCQFNVVVTDTESPVITCPADISVPAANGTCAANVSYSTPSATDNCSGVSVAYQSGGVSGSSFTVGTSTVAWRATDGAGRTADCTFTVTVRDEQAPTISCPADINTVAATSTCAATVSYQVPTAFDNCPGVTATRTAGLASNTPFPVGQTQVVYTATDASGNTTDCSFTVTVVDNQPPIIAGCSPTPTITLANDPGLCSHVLNYIEPTVTDNCPGATITRTAGFGTGSAFPVGTTTVTYVATDAALNTATCTVDIIVQDTEAPSIACPADITVNNSQGLCGTAAGVLTFPNASFSDNCAGTTLQQTGLTSGAPFPVGTHTITFVAKDAALNTNTCSFTVTVVDNEAPVFLVCPTDFTVGTDNGVCQAVVTYPTLLANDNCGGTVTPVMTTTGTASGSVFPLGQTTVTYTATDAVSNVRTCSFVVTVSDDEGPQLNCPSDQTVTFDANCQYKILNYLGQVSFLDDNCDVPTLVQSPAQNTTITGSTQITITATDLSGNASSCKFSVNPNDVVDPVITCPSDQQVPVNAICQFTLPNYVNAGATDDCDPNPIVVQSPIAGAILTATTPVTLTATDASGNSSSCTFNASPFDATNPTITCPSNQMEVFDAGCKFALSDYTGLASTADNCGGLVTVTQFPLATTVVTGPTLVTLTASDGPNSAICTFSVIPQDNQNPTIICPSDQNVNFNSNCQFSVGNYISLSTPDDNCDPNPSVTQSPVPGTSISSTTTAVLTVTDAKGNTGNCTFQIIPSDHTAPNITCPTDQLVNLNASCKSVLLNYIPQAIATDNCDGAPVKTQSPAAGTTITSSTTVTINVVDNVGNTNSCTFEVEVQDVTPPSISCGSAPTVYFDPSCKFTVGNYASTVTVADNCGGSPNITQSPASGAVITGLTTITMTATDASGNAANCTFNINPIDNLNPTVTCPGNMNVDLSATCNYTLADYTGFATATDNCDASVTKTQSPGFGTVITASTTVTITGTDDAGNTGTCSFAVIPADHTNPTITCPGNQTEAFTASCNFVVPNYTGLGSANDNCDNSVLITQSPAVGTVITGSQQVTLTGVDNFANSASCVFSIIPIDDTPPVITCPGDQDATFNAQCAFALINYTGLATATDNCGTIPVITQSPASGTSISSTSAVTLTAKDASGNTSTCSFDVIPTDKTIPSVNCPGDQTVSFNAGCGYTLLSYTGIASTNDNCDPSPTIGQSPAAGTNITTTTVITITATDASTNANTCTFSVIPVDNTNPTISCPSDLNVSFDAGCQFTLTDYTGTATTADNCTPSPVVSQSPASGTVITGARQITLTSTDLAGNLATCTFNVNPDDDIDPVIACPGGQTVSSNASCQFMIVDYTATATTSDNCDLSVAVTQSPAFGTVISVPTTVTLTAKDDNLNTATCTFLVTPADNNDPNITCPGDQIVDVDANCQFSIIDFTGLATATDNCSNAPAVTQDVTIGDIVTGTTTITLTATDTDFNTASCTFQLIPEDNTQPVVTCPGAQAPSLGAQCQLLMPDYTGSGSVNDNCDAGLSISQSPVAGSLIGGTTTVTFSSTDGAGNIGICTFVVTPADATAPYLACPSDRTEAFDTNCELSLPNYVSLATVSDNCDSPPLTVTQSPAAGSTIGGSTTVEFSVTDAANNTSTCTFDVLPIDDEDPTIICPSAQPVSFDGNCGFVLLDYTSSATIDDNCDNSPTVIQNPAAGTTLSSNTSVSITVTDLAGNSVSCSFNVTPTDDTDPVVICPANQSVNASANCGFNATDVTGLATVSDNCDNTPFITQSPAIGTLVFGQTTFTVTAVDDNGNSSFCTFDITPIDITPPTIQCPDDQSVSYSSNCDFQLSDYTSLAVATDNCDNSLQLSQNPPVSQNTYGSSTVITLKAIDDAGNSATCTFSVVPVDDTLPTISCPASATVNSNANCQFVLPNYIGQTSSSDNCDQSLVVAQSPLPGSSIGGTTTVTISATDDAGNIGTCSFVLTPADVQPPVFANCPSTIQVNNTVGSCDAVVTYPSLSVNDNCDGVLIPQRIAGGASGSVFVVGSTTVVYTATDNNNNTATCSFTVIVNDVGNPTIVCPANISVNVDPTTCGATVAYGLPTVFDNCTNGIVPTLQAGIASGGTFPRGTTMVTYQVLDGSGNTATCSFNVTVSDNEAPAITCPANVQTNVGPNSCQAFVTYSAPTITDNCATGLSPVLVSGISSGSVFPLGTTNVVYQANDGFGNSASCTFTVTVVDNISPIMFGCPIDLTVNVRPGTCGRVVLFAHPTATDNCIGSLTPQLTSGLASGSTFPTGVTTVTFKATDAAANVAMCSFNVTVVDNEDPVIVCPANITQNALTGTCGADVTYHLPTVSDNCNYGLDSTLLTGFYPDANFPVGTTVVTWEANDAALNTSTCSFTVTVVDDEDPVLTCPADLVVSTDPGQCGAVVTYSLPTVVDNCSAGIVPYVIIGSVSGSTFTLGDNTITYKGEDASGNTNTCTFTITVEDNENPVLTCPNDTLINCDVTVVYDLPAVSDNCTNSFIPVQTSPASGYIFPLGPTTVTFSGADASGNTHTCSFVVTIIDTVAPVITCPVNQREAFNALCQMAAPDYTALGSSIDQCDGAPIITQLPVPGATITGTATITLIATDVSGNTSTCTFDVIDDTPPVVTCPGNQTVGSDINCQFILLDYTTLVTTSDNCGASGLTQMPAAATLVSGNTNVIVTATDDFGNTSTCNFDVILEDNIAPSITCIGNQVGLFNTNCEYQVPNYTGQAFADDNCDPIPVISQFPAAGQMVQGDTLITLTATDANGNATSCSFSLLPSDNISPVITCPGSQQAQFNASCSFEMADYTASGTVTDNCSSAMNITVTQTPVAGTSHIANTIVTLTAKDEAGNSHNCVFVVVPKDQIAPVIACPADADVAVNVNCEFILTDQTLSAITTDNCSNSITVTQSPSIGTTLNSATLVTLTANDGNGNTATCNFTLTPDDLTPPVVICSTDIEVDFDQNCGFAVGDYIGMITATDNCGGVINYAQSPAAGTNITGSASITLTATDASGNSASCSFGVTPSDVTPPVVVCPGDQNVNLSAACGFVLPNYVAMATITDNCQLATAVQNIAVGTVITGQTAITITASDNAVNTESCTFNVIPADVSNPVITCPSNKQVNLGYGCAFVVDDYFSETQITDNCLNTVFTQTPSYGTALSTQTTVVMSVVDDAGNTASCSFEVIPSDNTVPSITCPQTEIVYLDANCQFSIPDYRSTALIADNCLVNGLTVSQFPPINTVVVSNTAITLTVADASGNQANCSFAVQPKDIIAPVITACPPDYTISVNANCGTVIPNFAAQVTATDNCSGTVTISQLPAAGTMFGGAGGGQITMIATDAAGNTAECQFNASIVDDVAPTVTCPSDQVLALNANCQFALMDYTTLATGSDACGPVVLTQSPVAGTVITTQLNTTIIVEDESGNTATCTFFVTPQPMTVTVTGTAATCNSGSNGAATVVATGGMPPYTENWGGFNPSALAAGNYSVVVTDANGCSSTGSVTIGDGPLFELEITPGGTVYVCQGQSTQLNAGAGYAVYNWSTGATVSTINVSNEASYWVKVADANGCWSNTDTATVVFYDPLVPQILTTANGMLECSNDSSQTYQWYLNGAPIPGAINSSHCPTVSGNYMVDIVDANGCEVQSGSHEITYDPNAPCLVGIEEHGITMDVFPNPSTGMFTVSYSLDHQMNVELTVFDLVGTRVSNDVLISVQSGTKVIDLSQQAEGVYLLRITLGNNKVLQQRLVLVK